MIAASTTQKMVALAAVFALVGGFASHARASGNVIVSVNNGKLTIKGDNENNSITIDGTATPGTYDISGALGTLVNGATSIQVSGVTSDVKVTLKNDDDTLVIADATLPRKLKVSTGQDSDTVILDNVIVGDDVKISTSRGSDFVSLDDAAVGRHLTISTSSDSDMVDFSIGSVAGKTRIVTGGDDDSVLITTAVTFTDQVKIATGGDGDTVTIDSASFLSPLKASIFNGGGGDDDVLTNGPGNTYVVSPKIKNFETVNTP